MAVTQILYHENQWNADQSRTKPVVEMLQGKRHTCPDCLKDFSVTAADVCKRTLEVNISFARVTEPPVIFEHAMHVLEMSAL